MSTATWAQQPPDAGRVLREQQKPMTLPAPQTPVINIDDATKSAPSTASSVRFMVKSIHLSGNTAFSNDQLMPLLQALIGKDSGFDELRAAALVITRFYREHGYPVARAFVPAQEIKDGAVNITVLEGRFGKVDLRNRSRVNDATVQRFVESFSGAAITQLRLERQMLLLHDLAGSGTPHSSLRAGEKTGSSDLTVDLAESKPFTGSVTLDNSGNRFTGGNRVSAEAALQSPFGIGDELNAKITHGFDDLDYGRIGYQLPVGGDGLKVGTEFSHSKYKLGRSFAPLAATGTADTANVNARYPFIRSLALNLYGDATLEWRNLQDRVGATNTVTGKSTRTTIVGISGDATHHSGITAFSLHLTSGKLDIESAAAKAIDAASARSNGNYSTLSYSLQHLQGLTGAWSMLLALNGQEASKNLDSSEKFILGGANGVRGYPQGEGVGDAGYVGTAELRYRYNTGYGVLQPYVFADSGKVKANEKPFIAGASNERKLSSIGTGLSWAKADDFELKLTVAWRGHGPAVSDKDETSRTWLQATKFF